ncbi:MAG: phospholipid carrier-dependent glycosyltransferase [Leptolyngbyaceae cyanobacterium CSU_1_3]|nr:phospholipid carrier-dependent glycosyltransferase [Leptolyngbyaceae cyanobacterium CSU_1_3]
MVFTSVFKSLISKRWLFLLVAFALLRLGFWFAVFPNSDEAYYWLWGQNPGWSYYDHPPLNAWIQGGLSAIVGRSTFALRLSNLFSNAALFYTYYKIISYLYCREIQYYFLLTVLLILASPLYFLFLSLAWHDHWLITFSLIAAYWFVTFLDGYLDRQAQTWRLYASAIAIGLAMLCKYNAIFVIFGFVAVLIADRRVRALWRDRRLYGAAAIVSLSFIPVLGWNISNGFQSFHYYFDRSVQPASPGIKVGAFLAFTIVSFLVVSPFYWRGFYTSLTRPSSLIRKNSLYPTVALWVFAVSSIFLILLSLVSAALYYWNITAYLLLFPLLPTAFFVQGSTQNSTLKVKPIFWVTQLYGLLFATLLVMHYGLLPLSALVSRDADPDSRMLFGWDKIETVVTTQAEMLGASPLLITTDYRSAAALAYQLNNKAVIALSDRVDQFDFWYPNNSSLQGRNAVILSDDWFPVPPKLLAQFDRVSPPETVSITRFGVWIKNYYVQKGYQFKGNNLWKK